MANTNEVFESDTTRDQLVELAEAANDEPTPRETFNDDVDCWARRAMAANGFGDY